MDDSFKTGECYLFPKFAALENGATPNFAEISEYLHNGIALDYVDDYRRHVPDCLPPAAPLAALPSPHPSTCSESGSSSPEPPSPRSAAVDNSIPSARVATIANRIPLLPPAISLTIDSTSAGIQVEHCNSEPALGSPRDRLISPKHTTPIHSPQPSPTPAVVSESSPVKPATSLPTSTPPVETSLLATTLPVSTAAVLTTPSPNPQPTPTPTPAQVPTTAASGVTLSMSECETFQYLSRVDPVAAHWFMLGALGRAAPQLSSSLNIAAEFRPAPPQFRPNVMAPEFRPRAFLPPPTLPPFPPSYPPQQMPMPCMLPPAHYPQFAPPANFMPPPGFGPH